MNLLFKWVYKCIGFYFNGQLFQNVFLKKTRQKLIEYHHIWMYLRIIKIIFVSLIASTNTSCTSVLFFIYMKINK